MNCTLLFLIAMAMLAAPRGTPPSCMPEPGRLAGQVRGEAVKGQAFSKAIAGGWILRLAPADRGWLLQISAQTREGEDLSRLTPPFHFVPNPRDIEGWHFRNADNTGPNDGSVNAPQELRGFIFSPRVGLDIQGPAAASAPTSEEVAAVGSFGRGWFFLESYELTPPRKGERAAFVSLKFSACLTWPAA
jgi:hypothetical protein